MKTFRIVSELVNLILLITAVSLLSYYGVWDALTLTAGWALLGLRVWNLKKKIAKLKGGQDDNNH